MRELQRISGRIDRIEGKEVLTTTKALRGLQANRGRSTKIKRLAIRRGQHHDVAPRVEKDANQSDEDEDDSDTEDLLVPTKKLQSADAKKARAYLQVCQYMV